MTALTSRDQLISAEDYLATEPAATQKREYLAGAGDRHHRLASNLLASAVGQLRGQPCQPSDSETRLRIRHFEDVRFSYPDLQLLCRSNSFDKEHALREVFAGALPHSSSLP